MKAARIVGIASGAVVVSALVMSVLKAKKINDEIRRWVDEWWSEECFPQMESDRSIHEEDPLSDEDRTRAYYALQRLASNMAMDRRLTRLRPNGASYLDDLARQTIDKMRESTALEDLRLRLQMRDLGVDVIEFTSDFALAFPNGMPEH